MAGTTLDRRVNIYINDKDAGKTIKAIYGEATKLRNEINKNLTPGTKDYYTSVKRLQELQGTIANHNKNVRGVASTWSKVKDQVIALGATALAYGGFQQIISGIDNMIGRNADLSDSFSDVRKTTGMTDDEVNSLNKSFKNFNTRTPRKELLDLSVVAGKLGIKGVADVSKFVKAADMINVTLGEDLGDIDTVVRNLGALNNLFNLDAMYGTAEAMTKVGSAINSVGASGTAREASLVDFTSRVGGAANSVGLLIDQVIGYGAVLDEAMVSSETSSTAISQFWIMMGKEAEKFSGIAGMEVEAFRKLMAEDFNAAFIKVLEGLKSTGGGIEELAATMSGAGVDSSRMIQSLQALANNTDKLREKQKLSADEFKKGTSLADEFAVKNDNLAAKLERLNKWFTGNFISGGIVKAFENLVGLADDFVNVPLAATLEAERMELNSLVNMLIEHNGNQERRNQILADIQSKYPDFLKNMDTELVTTETLTKALDSYNKEMLRKITLQAYEDQLMALAKEKVALEQERYDIEKAANDAAQKAAKILGVELSANMTLLEKFNKLQEESNKLGIGYFDQAKVQNASKYILEIQGLVKTSSTQDLFGKKTGLEAFNIQLAEIEGKMQGILDMRNTFDAANKTEQPSWLTAPVPQLTNIDPNTKFSSSDAKTTELTDEEKKKLEEQIKNTKKYLAELRELNLDAWADELALKKSGIEQTYELRKQEIESSKLDALTKATQLLDIEKQYYADLQKLAYDEFEQSRAIINLKQDLRIEDINATNADESVKRKMILAVQEQTQRDLMVLANKLWQEKQKHHIKQQADTNKLQKQQYEIEYRNLVAAAQLKIAKTVQGTKARLEAEQELILLQANWELSKVELTEGEKLLLKEETLQKLSEMQAEYRNQQHEADLSADEKAKEVREQTFEASINAINALAQGLQNVFSFIHDLRMKEIQDEKDALEETNKNRERDAEREKQYYQRRYESKKIDKQELDDFNREIDGRYADDRLEREKALDKKAAEIEKVAARRQRAIKLTMSIINTAAGVATALGSAPPPVNFINAAAVGAAGAIEIGIIAATKFAKGGHTLPLDSFSNGGNVNNTQIGMIGEAGPEWVAPNWMLRNPETANIIAMLEDMRINKRHYAVGGTTASQTPAPAFVSTTSTQTHSGNDKQLTAAINRLNANLERGITANAHLGDRFLLEMNERVKALEASQNRGKA